MQVGKILRSCNSYRDWISETGRQDFFVWLQRTADMTERKGLDREEVIEQSQRMG